MPTAKQSTSTSWMATAPGKPTLSRGLGVLETKLSHYAQARDNFDGAIDLYEKENNRTGQAQALSLLGALESLVGHND